jgi:hypothetical protein
MACVRTLAEVAGRTGWLGGDVVCATVQPGAMGELQMAMCSSPRN